MNEFDQNTPRDAHFSKRIKAGKRTYYFDVKSTRANDFYITITESKRKPGESEDRPIFEKHKLFLYKEDFDKFTDGLGEALDFIRNRRPGTEGMETVHLSNELNPEPENDQTGEALSSRFSNLDFDDLRG